MNDAAARIQQALSLGRDLLMTVGACFAFPLRARLRNLDRSYVRLVECEGLLCKVSGRIRVLIAVFQRLVQQSLLLSRFV